NVEAARDAGVSLAFFTGNDVFWKTRWEPSIYGSNTANRTLVAYKETHYDSPVDPQDPPTWTGTWMDPRFSPPADGGKPQNALTGQLFVVNSGTTDITVPSADSKLRFWRNTSVASLASGLDTGGGSNPTDTAMQQATVNLLADMKAQPFSLMPGLTPATASADTTAPASTLTAPAQGASLGDGAALTISGSATDAGGGVV